MNGKIYISGNDDLTNLSFPDLEKVPGEIDIEGNKELRDIVFPDLKNVDGSLILKGTFNEWVFPFPLLYEGYFSNVGQDQIRGSR